MFPEESVFLEELERMNVALSRAKECLVIVGDHTFCREAFGRSGNPLAEVLEYIETHGDDCAVLEEAQYVGRH
jgi:superfamily I DNA and/or RNA helicase